MMNKVINSFFAFFIFLFFYDVIVLQLGSCVYIFSVNFREILLLLDTVFVGLASAVMLHKFSFLNIVFDVI